MSQTTDVTQNFDADSLEQLFPVAGFREKHDISAEDYLALETAEQHRADYIYFRHNNDRPTTRVEQAYVYDYTQGPLYASPSRATLSELHRELWSACPVPLFIVFLPDEIQIFSSLKAPKLKGDAVQPAPLEVIKLAAKAQLGLDRFNARLRELDIGIFWDSSTNPTLENATREQSVYGLMLQQLRDTRRRLIRTGKLDKRHANRLLVMALLIRYLEERRDSKGHGVFPRAGEIRNGKIYKKGFFEEFADGATDFTSMVRAGGDLVRLLDKLSARFNGDAFELTNEERAYLMQADLSGLADFLAGQTGPQRVFWPLYSFNHLPVELISNVYEEFLGADKTTPRLNEATNGDDYITDSKAKGIVYTPPFLVDFLLAEAMPLDGPSEFRVLDPACGSGVFLVGVYRRLIARWRLANDWRRPDLETLKTLLRDNIHGVDLDPDAVSLTGFSLCIALCSELEPMEIWKNLKFDRLRGKNIVQGDFFAEIERKRWSKADEKFDLIIGNPPFAEKLTPQAITLNARSASATMRPELPNKQIALLFLEQAMLLLKPEGLTCLIEPAAPLLYNPRAQAFRRWFLERYDVPQILDFTHACRVIFGAGGDVAFAVIFAHQSRPFRPVLHVTVRRTRSVKEHIAFELDRYDFHLVPREVALNESTVWKANLVGGGRMNHLARRLSALPKLKKYLEARRKKRWIWGEGFIVSNDAHVRRYKALLKTRQTHDELEAAEFQQLEKKCKEASFITGKSFLPTKKFLANGIDEEAITVEKTKYFKRPRRKEIYSWPHLLIAERAYHDGIPAELRTDYLTFKSDIFAIHAPQEDASELRQMEQRLGHNRTLTFALLIESGRFAVNKSSAILAYDLLNLPYPKADSDLELNEWESILRDDALKHWLPYRRNGEKARVMRPAEDHELKSFGAIYTDFLSSIYPGLKADSPRKTATHVCYPFYFKKAPQLPDSLSAELDEALRDLTERHRRPSVRITRILRIYEEDVIYLIKPKTLRYWLKSMAIRDADDTFADLTTQGL